MRLPVKLRIAPGKVWTGHMKVVSRDPGGRYVVQFDAEDPKATHERYIYDCTVMSRDTIREWTGIDVELSP